MKSELVAIKQVVIRFRSWKPVQVMLMTVADS